MKIKINRQRLSSLLLAISLLWTNFANVCLAASQQAVAPPKGYRLPPRPLPFTPPARPTSRPKQKLIKPTQKLTHSNAKKIPPPAKPAHVRKGSRKVTLIKPGLSFSTHPSDLDLHLARVFPIPLTPMHSPPVSGENEALAKALVSYKQKTDPDDASDLTKFITEYPKSRWLASVELNLGRKLFEVGYLTEAFKYWNSSWELAKNEKTLQQRIIADEAFSNSLILKERLGMKSELKSDLKMLDKRHTVPSVRAKILTAKLGLSMMEKKPETSFKCGPFAVATILSTLAGKYIYNPVIGKTNSTDKGTNLSQLLDLTQNVGLHFQMAKRSPGAPVIVPSVMHWKLAHFAAITKKVGDRYRTGDVTFLPEGNFSLSNRALDSETDGYFLVPDGPLPVGWQKVEKEEGARVWGKGFSISWDGKSCNQPKTQMCPNGGKCGMATASAYSMQAQLNIQDIPLTYTPPVGPKIDILVNYDYATDYTVTNYQFPNFGTSARALHEPRSGAQNDLMLDSISQDSKYEET